MYSICLTPSGQLIFNSSEKQFFHRFKILWKLQADHQSRYFLVGHNSHFYFCFYTVYNMFVLTALVRTDHSCLPDVLSLAPEISVNFTSYINSEHLHYSVRLCKYWNLTHFLRCISFQNSSSDHGFPATIYFILTEVSILSLTLLRAPLMST